MPEEEIRRVGMFSGEDKYKINPPEPYMIEHFLYRNDYMMLQANKGVGKSVTALQILFSLTSGNKFLEIYDVLRPFNVLWLLGESTREKLIERVLNMKRDSNIDDDRWEYLVSPGWKINNDSSFKKLLDEIDKGLIKQYDAIILDSFYNFYAGSKNDDDAANRMADNIKKLANRYGSSIVALGHTNKKKFFQGNKKVEVIDSGDTISGSNVLDAFFTTIYTIDEVDGDNKILRIRKKKDRDGNCIDELTYRMIVPQEDECARLKIVSHDNEWKSNSYKLCELADSSPTPFRASEMIMQLGMSDSSFYRAVQHAIKEGRIVKDKDEFGRKIYFSSKLLKGVK